MGEHRLQRLSGNHKRARAFYNKQMLDHLNPLMCDFISRQGMLFMSTADSRGECDCSFRYGPPGFVQVLDEKTLFYPELRGNGVMASLGNISENPHIGMLFVDFFESTVGLHVNGKASIAENDVQSGNPELSEEILKQIAIDRERGPGRWVVIEVEEAYIHCAKHIPLLKKLDKEIYWGTDNGIHKGGDYFKAKVSPRPWSVVYKEPK
ncbi:MAG: pyridoxamine 5'-phosphate oxidase family protein [Rubrobacter sp.]|nr:pyridoxamine 5'-phosphate oxidase family protein [Rubrobacter sp.]